MFKKKITPEERNELIGQLSRLQQEDRKLDEEMGEARRQRDGITAKYNQIRNQVNAYLCIEEERKLQLQEKNTGRYRGWYYFLMLFLVMVGAFICYIPFGIAKWEAAWEVAQAEEEAALEVAGAEEEALAEEAIYRDMASRKADTEKEIRETIREKYRTRHQEADNEIKKWQNKLFELTVQEKQTKEILLTKGNEEDAQIFLDTLLKKSTKEYEKFDFMGAEYYTFQKVKNKEFYGNMDGGTNIIYPGALIKGESLFTQAYTPLQLPRGSMTLTCDGQSDVVENISYVNVQGPLKKYEDKAFKEGTYQESHVSTITIDSADAINSSLGVTAEGTAAGGVHAGAQSSLAKSYKEDRSNVMAVIRQRAYTVTAEPSTGQAIDFFGENADLAALGNYVPAYISKVDYGRCIVMLVTSTESEETLASAISASLKAVGQAEGDAKAELDKQYARVEVEFTIQIIGGPAESGNLPGTTVNDCMNKLSEILEAGEQGQIVNPIPISYELRYITDNSSVDCMSVSDSWNVRTDEVTVKELSWNPTDWKSGWFKKFKAPDKAESTKITVEGSGHGIQDGPVVVSGDNVFSYQGGQKGAKSILLVTSKDGQEQGGIRLEVWQEGKNGKAIETETLQINLFDEDGISTLADYGISVREVNL